MEVNEIENLRSKSQKLASVVFRDLKLDQHNLLAIAAHIGIHIGMQVI